MTVARAAIRWCVLLSATVAPAACHSPTESQRDAFALSTSEPPLVVGHVTGFTNYGALVAYDSGSIGAGDSVVVSIPSEPHSVYLRSGAKAPVSAVTIGRRVSVWTTDVVIYTNPAIVAARLVVLEP